MKLVRAMLTALTCFLPTTASFVLLPPTSTTTTTATLRDGCVGTDQRTSRSRSRSHSQPLPPSSSSSLALLSPLSSKAARMAEKATCLAMVAESDSRLQAVGQVATAVNPLVAFSVVDGIASQMLKQHKETLAREVAIHKEDLAFRRMEFEHQQTRDRQSNSARDANFEFEKARAARQDARDAYQRERNAKQDAREDARDAYRRACHAKQDIREDVRDERQLDRDAYQRQRDELQDAREDARDERQLDRDEQQAANDKLTKLCTMRSILLDTLDRNEKKMQRLRSIDNRTDAEEARLQTLQTKYEEIEGHLGTVRHKLREALALYESLH